MLRVGVLGCGTIGKAVCDALLDPSVAADLMVIVENQATDQLRARLARADHRVDLLSSVEPLLDRDLDLVVEAAHPSVAERFAVPILNSGKDLLVMSIGGLVKPGMIEAAHEAAVRSHRTLILPAGAISGISTIRAASLAGELSDVEVSTIKAPASLEGAPFLRRRGIQLSSLTRTTLIFDGNVVDAIEGFPKNVNVAAAVALAGLGVQKTRVRVIADPCATRTVHRVRARGSFGELDVSVVNVPDADNPRTSRLAVLGAISALRQRVDHVMMGV
ncbi:MAG: aspartate dehydrogenase [Candidatus Bipolaricaulia bacterium]